MDQLPDDHFVTVTQFTRKAYRDVYPAIDPTSSELSLAGRVAIITGASRGIGAQGIAPAFAKAGPKGIVLIARNSESLKEADNAVKSINPKIETLLIAADVSDPASVKDAFDQVAKKYGHADILVNNAAVVELGQYKDIEFEAFKKQFSVNADGVFLASQAFLRQLPEGTRGNIMTMTSTAAYNAWPYWSGYSLSKLAAMQQMAFIAAENPNVSAVSINPGLVMTDSIQDIMKKFAKDSAMLTGGTMVWLCSEGAQFMSGRYTIAHWDVVELKEREEEIKEKDLLKINMSGTFGTEQFGGKSEVIG